MTIKELHNATAALGFEDSLESAEVFYAAANRALYCANRIRPKISELSLSVSDGQVPTHTVNGRGYILFSEARTRDDFMCYTPTPVLYGAISMCEGRDYIILGDGDILISADIRGDIRICYYRAPRKMKNDDEDAKIDLDEDICQILPLLVASYVWMEDESEKAAIYKNLFYSEAREIEDFAKRRSASAYVSDAGWCD